MNEAVWHRLGNERISTSAQVAPVLGNFCCSYFMWFVLELPPSQPVPYSVPHGICGPFFIIIPYCLFFCLSSSFQLCPEPKKTPITGLRASSNWSSVRRLKLPTVTQGFCCQSWRCHVGPPRWGSGPGQNFFPAPQQGEK